MPPDMPHDADCNVCREEAMFSNRRSLTIEWGHCDPAGIVFNPRYFEFFDWSTAVLIHAATGFDKLNLLARHGAVGWPLVYSNARFLRPCRYDEGIEILSAFTEVGRSSFRVRHQLFNTGELAVDATEIRVWTAVDHSRPGGLTSKPIPEHVAAAFRGE
jgi:4-hydroxybenzoyl-CoA thioesterase